MSSFTYGRSSQSRQEMYSFLVRRSHACVRLECGGQYVGCQCYSRLWWQSRFCRSLTPGKSKFAKCLMTLQLQYSQHSLFSYHRTLEFGHDSIPTLQQLYRSTSKINFARWHWFNLIFTQSPTSDCSAKGLNPRQRWR